MNAGTVFTLEDATSSTEAMAASWYKDLIDGTAAASGLSPRLRATLAFVTQELAEERGRQVLRLIRERKDGHQRQDEATGQRVLAAQRAMVKELRRLKAKSTGSGPLTVATIADVLSNNWDMFVDFFREQSVGLFSWLEETGEPNVSERIRQAMALGEQPPRPERLMAAFCVAFSSEPKPWYQGRPVDRASLARLARSVVARGPVSGDDEDGQFLTSLLESGVLTAFAKLEGHDNLAIVESQWRSWVDEWQSTKLLRIHARKRWGAQYFCTQLLTRTRVPNCSAKLTRPPSSTTCQVYPNVSAPGQGSPVVMMRPSWERDVKLAMPLPRRSPHRCVGLDCSPTGPRWSSLLTSVRLSPPIWVLPTPGLQPHPNASFVRKLLQAQPSSDLALEALDRLKPNATSSVTSRND